MSVFGNKCPTFLPLTELEDFVVIANRESDSQLSKLFPSDESSGDNTSLSLSSMEQKLKDMVLSRVIGHLEAGAREKDNGVLAKDVTRFCN